MIRTLPVLALAVAALIPSTAPPSRAVTVRVTDFAFLPRSIEVRHGDTVRFIQAARNDHTVEFTFAPVATQFADDPGATPTARTASRPPRRGPTLHRIGDVYDVVITEAFAPGAHHYSCTNVEHAGMAGVIVVRE